MLHCWFILVQRPLAWRIYVMSIFILVFLLAISPRPLNRSSPNLPVRWQIGNNKVKLLVSELFRLLEGGSNRPLSLRTQLHKMQHGVKTELLVEKDSCAILAGHIFCNGMRFKLY